MKMSESEPGMLCTQSMCSATELLHQLLENGSVCSLKDPVSKKCQGCTDEDSMYLTSNEGSIPADNLSSLLFC